MNQLGERIKQLRGKETQAAFALKLGIHKNTLIKWEKGERHPDYLSIVRVITEYKLNPDWFLFGEGDMYGQLSLDKPNTESETLGTLFDLREKYSDIVTNYLKLKGEFIKRVQKTIQVSDMIVSNIDLDHRAFAVSYLNEMVDVPKFMLEIDNYKNDKDFIETSKNNSLNADDEEGHF